MANEILPLTAFQEKWRHWRKAKWKSTLNIQIKMASTKRDNCIWKRNYADARKFRKKNHNLTVVYVQRLCYQDTKTCFKMHSITAKDGKTWYLVQRTSFTIPLASECWGEQIIARVMKSSWQSLILLTMKTVSNSMALPKKNWVKVYTKLANLKGTSFEKIVVSA